MRSVKILALAAAVALTASAAAAADVPQSLQQLDQQVAETHPFNTPGSEQTYQAARDQAAQAYAAGNTEVGRHFEGYARHLAGINWDAPAASAAAVAGGH